MTAWKIKRTAKASRFYETLLRCYPISFQQEYREMLVLQFQDELTDTMKKEKRLGWIRFWSFILFDFICSLLTEFQREVMKMNPKKLSSYGVFAAIITALAWGIIWGGGNVSFIGRSEIVSLSLFSLILIGGSIAMLGIIKVILHGKFFHILSVLLLIFTGIYVVENFYLIMGYTFLPDLLGYAAFEILYWCSMFGYFAILAVIGGAVLVKRRWLPAISMLVISLPILIIPLVNLFNAYWMITLFGVLSSAGWLMIGWWLKKESTVISPSKPLEVM